LAFVREPLKLHQNPAIDAQDFVKFNYWDGGRKGLLCGEALYLDLKRMELAYLDGNRRELELTTHVSLRQLEPVALLSLRSTGSCSVEIPEWLFDRDCPGHYLRRIKTVALSIPSVVGPYSSVNCTLTLMRSSVRKSPDLLDGEYARQGATDARFVDYPGATQSIVTSTAVVDSGLFDANLHDERMLPFEGAGAASTWKLELPRDYPAFDYATITDVILHVRYTAKAGVDAAKVRSALADLFSQTEGAGFVLLFSLRHEFPNEWWTFVNGTGDFKATVRKAHFPYFAQHKALTVTGLQLYGADVTNPREVGDVAQATTELADGDAVTVAAAADAAGPTAVLTRSKDADVFMVVRYQLG
jgi:hypothetical protein